MSIAWSISSVPCWFFHPLFLSCTLSSLGLLCFAMPWCYYYHLLNYSITILLCLSGDPSLLFLAGLAIPALARLSLSSFLRWQSATNWFVTWRNNLRRWRIIQTEVIFATMNNRIKTIARSFSKKRLALHIKSLKSFLHKMNEYESHEKRPLRPII